MNVLDELAHTTIRIETKGATGRGSGTGFFYNCVPEAEIKLPLVITNKHVIRGTTSGLLLFSRDQDGKPEYRNQHRCRIDNFEQQWIPHPDPSIDLAAMPVAPIVQALKGEGFNPFFRWLAPELIPSAETFQELSAIEEVLMIGYPQGIWDSVNNMPVCRRGVTATPPYLDFEGRPEFVIDCAVFNGSSGSPVVLFDKGFRLGKTGGLYPGAPQARLLGILWGGPSFGAEGEIKAVPVPTNVKRVAIVPTLMNLGYCVRADQLHWFGHHCSELARRQQAAHVSSVTTGP